MIIYQKEVSPRLKFIDHDDGSLLIQQEGYGFHDCVSLNEAECIDLYQFLCVKFAAS